MTSETDEQFLNNMEQYVIDSLVFKRFHRERLFALARRGAALVKVKEGIVEDRESLYIETTYTTRQPFTSPPSGEPSDE